MTKRGALPVGFLLALATTVACSQDQPSRQPAGDELNSAQQPVTGEAAPCLRDITEQVGLDFVHAVPGNSDFSMPDIIGSGGAVFDANGDQRLDLYLVSSSGPNRLFTQDATGTFTDQTERSGAGDPGYGMGTALGDFDNDGDLDLYLTNLGSDALLRNEGDGTFTDVTQAVGIVADGWSVSAGFFDYDSDGWLDLYVVSYVDFDPTKACTSISGRPDYCGPSAFTPAIDLLLHNHQGKRFSQRASELSSAPARAGLGLAIADFNADGSADVFVANDGEENQLWLASDHGLVEQGIAFGIAVNQLGRTEAGMGVALADLNGDLDLDLLLTHLENESNTLYLNLGGVGLEDRSGGSGLAIDSLPWTGFGVDALDLDLDGDLEVAIANGKVRFTNTGRAGSADDDAAPRGHTQYVEPNSLFVNQGQGRFARSVCASLFEQRRRVSRGLVAADIDGDGDPDLLVTNNQGSAELWDNVQTGGNWIAVRAVDPALNRDAVGALVRIEVNDTAQVRPITHVKSFLMSTEASVLFGLGDAESVDSIQVLWPGKREHEATGASWENFGPHQANRSITLLKGGSPQ